jgi:23S rRNA G2445 N2-methylase RlmL
MAAFREAAFSNFLQKAKQPFALKEHEKFEILCSDKSEKAVKTIKHNIEALHAESVQVSRVDFFSLPPSKNALLVLNPPYGKRLIREKNLYREIASKIERDFSGCAIAAVCPANEAVNFENLFKGRRLDRICSYNGGMRICLFHFFLY